MHSKENSKRDRRRPVAGADRDALRRQVRHPYITRQSPEGQPSLGTAPQLDGTDRPAAVDGASGNAAGTWRCQAQGLAEHGGPATGADAG